MKKLFVYLELVKPRLLLMALATTLSSFYMSSRGLWDQRELWLLAHTLLGAGLVGGAANTLNQYLERALDAKMKRTENRPLPSGRLTTQQALLFGCLLFVAGLLEFALFVNPLSCFMALALFLGYLFLYTPLKQKTPINTWVGAGIGALPVFLGWLGSGAPLEISAFLLFLILFVWQLPHFFAIAWLYREDYRRGGFRMISLCDKNGSKTAWTIFGFCIILVALSVMPSAAGITGLTYLFLAIFFGCLLLGFALFNALNNLSNARRFIPVSIIYLLVLNISMIVDKVSLD